jgi:hypothetical protein
MTDKEYIEFLDQYAGLLRAFETHFSGLKDNWKEVTGRNCPFITRELTYESRRMLSDIENEKADLISADIVCTEWDYYTN